MQGYGVLAVLVAGAALATYAALIPAADGEAELAEITRISAAPDRVRSFSFGSSLPQQNVASKSDAQPSRVASIDHDNRWSSYIRSDEEDGAADPVLNTATSTRRNQRQLVARIQKQLARHGCYTGRTTGRWTRSTEIALARFMDATNASLPAGPPDDVHLALVSNHRSEACRKGDGQVVADNFPLPVRNPGRQRAEIKTDRMALQTARTPKRAEQNPVRTASTDVVVPPLPGRMNVGAPQESENRQQQSDRDALDALIEQVAPIEGPANERTAVNRADTEKAQSEQVASIRRDAENLAALDNTAVGENVPSSADIETEVLEPAEPGSAEQRRASRKAAYRKRRAKYRRSYRARSYAARRRGEPRRGSMQYNVMKSLGGIY